MLRLTSDTQYITVLENFPSYITIKNEDEQTANDDHDFLNQIVTLT